MRNRNALRSQRGIRDAFVALAMERGDGRITVSDICRVADINRTTFYAHYDSLEDLEAKLWVGYFDGFTQWLSAELEQDFLEDPLPGLNRLSKIIEDTKDLFIVFGARKTEERLRDVDKEGGFGMAVRDALLKATGPLPAERMVCFDFVSSAMLNVYYTWMIGQYGDLSIDKLNEQLALYLQACFAADGSGGVRG